MKAELRNPVSDPRPSGERDTQRDYARRLRREQTDAERTLWRALGSHQFNGLKFRRQHPTGPYIVDSCCLTLKLAIELDGGQHALQADADDRRSHDLAQAGYRVLRFWNREVLMNLEGVLERIAESARPSPQPSPRGRGGSEMLSPPGRGRVESSPGATGRNRMSFPKRRGRTALSSHSARSAFPAEHSAFRISHSASPAEHSLSPISHSSFHIDGDTRGGCS